MIATTYTQAQQLKAASAIPMDIKNHAQGWQLVSRYQSLSFEERRAILTLSFKAIEQHGNLRAYHSEPAKFFDQFCTDNRKGAALASKLKQLNLLKCYEGKFSLTVSAINMIESINQPAAEH
ncbi:hypothetical protein JAO78_005315 [Alishewanella sp. 16-MA]|uniref:Uncharacterized protein n=1 Tax=Alishewanella maricola TaxID=2795740 RepID=A0ABS8C1N5_9ALTE|nr:hypothetical protein [Alishewanella maricola]MCB5226231.1 hypothetical protein [Alishewanella maricola]